MQGQWELQQCHVMDMFLSVSAQSGNHQRSRCQKGVFQKKKASEGAFETMKQVDEEWKAWVHSTEEAVLTNEEVAEQLWKTHVESTPKQKM